MTRLYWQFNPTWNWWILFDSLWDRGVRTGFSLNRSYSDWEQVILEPSLYNKLKKKKKKPKLKSQTSLSSAICLFVGRKIPNKKKKVFWGKLEHSSCLCHSRFVRRKILTEAMVDLLSTKPSQAFHHHRLCFSAALSIHHSHDSANLALRLWWFDSAKGNYGLGFVILESWPIEETQ